MKPKIDVPGNGPKYASIMIIGEAPGREEVLRKKPFVGRAGRFLTKILEKNKIDRNKIYVTNVVKFRTPDNRKPNKKEILAYADILEHEIETIRPRLVVLLGNTAIEAVLGKYPVTRIRGKIIKIADRKLRSGSVLSYKILPTFHPAVAMRNRKYRKLFEQDVKKIRRYH